MYKLLFPKIKKSILIKKSGFDFSGAPMEKKDGKKILEYLIENAEEIYENILKLERILI